MNIAIIGYGKMGKAIEEIALKRGHSILLKINSSNTSSLTKDALQQCDVAIEFTGPETAVENMLKCFDAGIPVVCGSTGWLQQLEKVTAAAKDTGFLYASNFSVGVNMFFEINKKLADLMNRHESYDVSVEEIHHTAKKDAPSGTAITIAEDILKKIPHKKNWVNRPAENAGELSIISKRIDPAPGTHIVNYHSDIDDIEIKHTAHNRKGFATGAVLAAEFLQGKRGIFSMKEVLGL